MRPRRSHLVSLLVLILISAVIRWIYYQEIRDTSLFRIPQLDSEYYRNWALDLLQGDWGRGEPYWMGPLYPHLLALTYVVFGPAGAAPQLLQWLGTLASIVIVFLIALRIAGGWPACLAAFLYAFYAVPVFYAGFLLMATLLTLLFLLCLWQCLRILERPTPRRALVLGLLFGAAGLARGNMLLVGLFVPLVFWGLPLPRRRRLALTGALLLGGLLVILPVTARNMLVGHDLVLLTSNGGFNLYIGQQTEYRGTFGQQEIVLDLQADPAGELRLEKELGRDLKPSEVSRIYTGRAVREVLSQPGAAILHYARKAYRFWNGYELPQIAAFGLQRERSPALRLLFVPYAALAALGLLGLMTMRGPTRRVMVVFVSGYFLSLLLFFPTARYRMPLAPLLAVTAALFLAGIIDRMRAKAYGRGLRDLLLAGMMTTALLPPWAALARPQVAWQDAIDRAYRALAEKNEPAALSAIAAADRALPQYAGTYYRLGYVCQQFDDDERALAAYRQAESLAPADHILPYWVGRTLHRLGRPDEALAAFARSAALDSSWGQPYFGIAMVYRDQGNLPAALSALERAVRLSPGEAHHRNNLASLYAETGHFDRARETLEQLVAAYPRYAKGWINLALVQSQLQQPQAARASLAKVARLPDLTSDEKANIQGLLDILNRKVSR